MILKKLVFSRVPDLIAESSIAWIGGRCKGVPTIYPQGFLVGVQFANSGVLWIADNAMRVNLSGISTAGNALRISGSRAFTISTIAMFLVSFTGCSFFAAASCSKACFTSVITNFPPAKQKERDCPHWTIPNFSISLAVMLLTAYNQQPQSLSAPISVVPKFSQSSSVLLHLFLSG